MTDALCSVCGLALHRYSPNHEGSGTDLMGCVNSLRGEVERLHAAEQERDGALRQRDEIARGLEAQRKRNANLRAKRTMWRRRAEKAEARLRELAKAGLYPDA